MRLEPSPYDRDISYGHCDHCGALIYRQRGQGDLECRGCGAIYNCFGQRLRDDLYSHPNYSEVDEDLDDLEGYEQAMLRTEYGNEEL